MKRLGQEALAAAVVALATARLLGGDPPPASPKPELDPQEVFQSAIDRLKVLEAKHGALKGASEVKPRLQLDDDKRLKSTDFVFEQNATPPGKGPAKAKDEAKPFVYVSVQVWSGHSQQPPAGLRVFKWKGEEYVAWVQVYGSNAELVQAVRKAVDEPILTPVPKN
jgi:hypothetical protein